MKPKAVLTFDFEFWYNSKFLKKYLPQNKTSLKDNTKKSINSLLNLLDKYDQKATFFVLGQLAEKYPETTCGEKSIQSWLSENSVLSDKGSTALHEDENIYLELVSVTDPSIDDASVELTFSGTKGTEGIYINPSNILKKHLKKIRIMSMFTQAWQILTLSWGIMPLSRLERLIPKPGNLCSRHLR